MVRDRLPWLAEQIVAAPTKTALNNRFFDIFQSFWLCIHRGPTPARVIDRSKLHVLCQTICPQKKMRDARVLGRSPPRSIRSSARCSGLYVPGEKRHRFLHRLVHAPAQRNGDPRPDADQNESFHTFPFLGIEGRWYLGSTGRTSRLAMRPIMSRPAIRNMVEL